ncbi:MAG: NERD domain-containing protein [Oscillospiraceae bacterium]|jgi:hypothetical protein|nr:NERD domain-containing protein [Oscillospiraceae bacterium]
MWIFALAGGVILGGVTLICVWTRRTTEVPLFDRPHDNPQIGVILEIAVANLASCGRRGYYVLRDVTIPRAYGKSSQIDVILIYRHCIIAFECKNWSGAVSGKHEGEWTQTLSNGAVYSHTNPIKQNAGHAAAVREYLDNSIGIKPYIHSVIVFGPNCTLGAVSAPSWKQCVIRIDELLDEIERTVKTGKLSINAEQNYNALVGCAKYHIPG